MNTFLYLVVFLLWAVTHTLLAATRPKTWLRAHLGERAFTGFYRLFYNIVAGVTFLPILILTALTLPQTELIRLPAPWSWLALALQGVGLLGLAISLLQTDLLDFLGLRQVGWYLAGSETSPPSPRLVTGGTYAVVRHPLYFFSLLVLWFNPVLTVGGLVFDIAATLYFWIGSIYEERKLARLFGAAYEAYRREVPALLPWPRRRR